MTPITNLDSLYITGLSATVLVLLTWIVLREAQSRTVHLWCVGGAMGAVYAFSTAIFAPQFSGGAMVWVVAGLSFAQGGIFFKWVSLRLIRDVPLLWNRAVTAWCVYVGMLSILILVVDQVGWAARFVAFFNAVLLLLIARESFHIARSQGNSAGYWLGFFLGMNGLLFTLSGFAPIPEGTNPLVPRGEPASWVAAVILFVNAAATNAFFIGLILNRALRENEDSQKALRVAERERLRAEERERLLADMHDGLGSQLATARLRVERSELPQQEVVELLRECMADLHLMVDTLREDTYSFADALADYRFRTERRFSEHSTQIIWSLSVDRMPPLQQRALLELLRIIQESINNAVRHARASRLEISARFDPMDGLAVEIIDNGVGLPEPLVVRRGVNNMHRRARAVGASLELGSREDGRSGACVALRLTPEQLQTLQRPPA